MSVSVCRAILPFLFLNKNLGGWERRGAKIHWQPLNKKWKYKVLWFFKDHSGYRVEMAGKKSRCEGHVTSHKGEGGDRVMDVFEISRRRTSNSP